MAKEMNFDVVAEGVENKEQVEFLKSEQCHYFQGFYYAKPQQVSEFEEKALLL